MRLLLPLRYPYILATNVPFHQEATRAVRNSHARLCWGMGEVYKARDTRLDRTVAIKVLPSDLAGHSELCQRPEREARAASRLSHASASRAGTMWIGPTAALVVACHDSASPYAITLQEPAHSSSARRLSFHFPSAWVRR